MMVKHMLRPAVLSDGRLDIVCQFRLQDEVQEVAMETDPCSDDLHLILDTSTDASDNKDVTGSESEGPSINSPKPVPQKPLGIQVKSADGKPKRIQVTTLSTLTSPSASKGKSPPQVPKSPSVSGIQVKSADGKPKKVQITTLTTYTSPKSKSQAKSSNISASGDQSKGDSPSALKAVENKKGGKIDEQKTNSAKTEKSSKLSESAVIDLTANEKGDNSVSGAKGTAESVQSPGAKSDIEGKQTAKRVQLTTIKLFSTPNKDGK